MHVCCGGVTSPAQTRVHTARNGAPRRPLPAADPRNTRSCLRTPHTPKHRPKHVQTATGGTPFPTPAQHNVKTGTKKQPPPAARQGLLPTPAQRLTWLSHVHGSRRRRVGPRTLGEGHRLGHAGSPGQGKGKKLSCCRCPVLSPGCAVAVAVRLPPSLSVQPGVLLRGGPLRRTQHPNNVKTRRGGHRNRKVSTRGAAGSGASGGFRRQKPAPQPKRRHHTAACRVYGASDTPQHPKRRWGSVRGGDRTCSRIGVIPLAMFC